MELDYRYIQVLGNNLDLAYTTTLKLSRITGMRRIFKDKKTGKQIRSRYIGDIVTVTVSSEHLTSLYINYLPGQD